MESGILGNLFGVDIHYPFLSADIHEVINARAKKVGEWKKEGFAELQIWDFEDKEFDKFKAGLTPDQIVLFEQIHTYECENYINPKALENLTLFGVKINYPFTHENIREAAKAERALVKNAPQKGSSETDAVIDSSNTLSKFYEKLGASKAIREFGNIWIIETQNILSKEQVDSAIQSQKVIQEIKDEEVKINGFFNVITILVILIAIGVAIKLIS